MAGLFVNLSWKTNSLRRAFESCPAFYSRHLAGSCGQRMYSSRCVHFKTVPLSWRIGRSKSWVGWASNCNSFFNQSHAALPALLLKVQDTHLSANFDRCYSSARPLRDVKPVRDGRIDIATEEVCLTSGKSAKLCSCSCCAEKRAWNNAVQSSSACHGEVDCSSGGTDGLTKQISADDQQNSNHSTQVEAPIEKPLGLLKRFKLMYKQYGIVMLCVHWSLASVWTGVFYYAAISGVNVVPVLKWLGASDAIISPFLRPSIGNAAVTYLLYKLATPLRYAVTIAATQLTVKYLRQWGYMKPQKPDDSLRSLVSDGRTKVKGKMDEVRDKVEDKMDEVRDRIETVRDKVEDRMDEVRDRIETVRDKVEDKMDEVRDRIETVRDKVEDKLDHIRDDVHELKEKLDTIRNQKTINTKIVQRIKSSVHQNKVE